MEERFDEFDICLPVVIRPCQRDDLPALEWFGMFRPRRRLIASVFRRQERGQALIVVAEVNGVAAGQVWIDLSRARRHGTAKLWALRVLPCLQNRGIAKRLIAAAEAVSGERRAAWVELEVDKDNPDLQAFYQRRGYRRVEDISDPGATAVSGECGVPRWRYRKALTTTEAGGRDCPPSPSSRHASEDVA